MSLDEQAEGDGAARRDRESIDRLADEVLPSLIAGFRDGDLGELEVRRGGWRVRLRRPLPADAGDETATNPDRGAKGGKGKRVTRAGHVSAGHTGTASGNGQATPMAAVGPGRAADPPAAARQEATRPTANSPGVGYFIAREGIAGGQAVRGGDVLGHVDVLGVKQEVVAPTDGIVARMLAEQGQAVEYGQELVRLDPPARAEPAREA